MVTPTRIIGIGQPAAGDDGVGIAVAAALRDTSLPDPVDVITLPDPTQLIDWLNGVQRVILVDAVIGHGVPGDITRLGVDDFAEGNVAALSSHGMDSVQSIRLARMLTPETIAPDICIVGISIDPPGQYTYQMSPEVSAAIPKAVALLRELIGD